MEFHTRDIHQLLLLMVCDTTKIHLTVTGCVQKTANKYVEHCPRTMTEGRVHSVFQWIIRSVSFEKYEPV